MLNEGMILNRSLKAAGLRVAQFHPHFKKLGKGDGFVVSLNAAGGVENIEPRTGSELMNYWQLQPDNQKRFPTIKLPCPLVEPPVNLPLDELRRKTGWLDWLRDHGSKAKPQLGKSARKLGSRLTGYPAEVLQALQQGAISPELETFLELCRRAAGGKSSAEERAERFTADFLKFLSSQNNLGAEELETFLLGSWNKKNKEFEDTEALLYLDLADYRTATKAACRVFDTRVGEAVNAKLLEIEAAQEGVELGVCSLTGERMALETDKLPNPNLPQLGLAYLFSMNRDAPCHDRYRMIGPSVFNVGRNTANEIKDAFQHLTQPDLKNQTWAGVPGISADTNDLLIAYLENLPRPPKAIPIPALLSSPNFQEGLANKMYGSLAREVVSTIRELKVSDNMNKELVRFIVISKVDPGRCQTVMERAITVEVIAVGAREWERACENVPDFWLFIPEAAKKPAVQRRVGTLYPGQVQRSLAYQWLQCGERKERVGGTKVEEKKQVAGCPLGDVFDLIYGVEQRRRFVASNLLPIAVSRASPMLLQVGGALHRDEERELSVSTRAAAIDVYTLLGALLHILDKRKERYMKGAAYQIGRMLSLADTLHKCYCRVVRSSERNSGVPPQLVGNSLMASALTNPTQALAVLSERIRVYKGWADTVQGSNDKDIGLAIWALKELGSCADVLAEQEIPTRMNDATKAELLIGYLTRPSSGRDETSAANVQNGESQ